MCKSLLVATIICLLLGTVAHSDPPTSKPRVADLAWLAGTWRALDDKDKLIEEVWAEPIGGTMIGMFRQVAPGRKAMFEFLVIEDDEQGATKRFKHYLAEFKDVEKDPMVLRVAEATNSKVVFQATTEGKLKSIVYEREGDRLKVAVNSTRDNKPFQIALTMGRVKPK